MAESEIIYGVLNVIAHPHPDGVYPELLRKVARRPARFWGDDFAAITVPEKIEPGLYKGNIIVWTEIDRESPAIDKGTLHEVSLTDLGSEFTERYGVNGKVFLYVFREKDHRLFFESINEFGKTLSPMRAEKIVGKLLAPPYLDSQTDPEVTVRIQPEEDALDRVLGIHRLGRLEIDIPRPNADDMSDSADEVLKEIEEQKARRYQKTLVAQNRQSLRPNQRTLAEAELAVQTAGYVRGIGKDENGERDDRSTKQYPKTIRSSIQDFASRTLSIMAAARTAVVRNGNGEDI